LRDHRAVREAVVVSSEDGHGNKRLAAYVVPQPQRSAPTPYELRSFLKERLPTQMIPSVFVVLDTLPLTSNGKLDRHALPAPELSNGNRERYIPATTQLERTLTKIWQDVLGHDRVGRNDNFFDLGGHSLLLTRVQSRLREALNRDVPIIDLLQYSTIRSLSVHLDSRQSAQSKPTTPDLEQLKQGRHRLKRKFDLTIAQRK